MKWYTLAEKKPEEAQIVIISHVTEKGTFYCATSLYLNNEFIDLSSEAPFKDQDVIHKWAEIFNWSNQVVFAIDMEARH